MMIRTLHDFTGNLGGVWIATELLVEGVIEAKQPGQEVHGVPEVL